MIRRRVLVSALEALDAGDTREAGAILRAALEDHNRAALITCPECRLGLWPGELSDHRARAHHIFTCSECDADITLDELAVGKCHVCENAA